MKGSMYPVNTHVCKKEEKENAKNKVVIPFFFNLIIKLAVTSDFKQK